MNESMYILLKIGIFQCHVSFQGQIQKKKHTHFHRFVKQWDELEKGVKEILNYVSGLNVCCTGSIVWGGT